MRRRICLVCSGLILSVLILIFILPNLGSSGHLELLEVKDERVQSLHCKIFDVKWHGRTTNLKFTLYRRSRMAGLAVPGMLGATWIQAGIFGKTLTINDGDVITAKNGDKFKLAISISAAYIRISYDNQTMHFSGTTGKMTEIEN